MLTATENSIRSLLEDNSKIIIENLASIKLALERLYESSESQLPRKELFDDLTKIVEISERIKSINNIEEKIKIFFLSNCC
jgi:hypothetical protein